MWRFQSPNIRSARTMLTLDNPKAYAATGLHIIVTFLPDIHAAEGLPAMAYP